MRTLGIDLSATAKKTAYCVVEWQNGQALVQTPVLGADDDALIAQMQQANCTGIDAPFGWPEEFLAAVVAYSEQGAWPIEGVSTAAEAAAHRARLRYRETDRFVAERARLPLSVSSDRIAVTAMRCAQLLTTYAERDGRGAIDRSGDDGIVEVYPGAALVVWSDETAQVVLDPQGYKGAGGADKRKALLDALGAAAPYLGLDEQTQALCAANDDALDALLSALIARAAVIEQTMRPRTMQQTASAHVEGWIHLPEVGSLPELAADC